MKNYFIRIILVVFLGLLFFSCNDEFLDKVFLDEISNLFFWNIENDLRVYNNSLYYLVCFDENVFIFMGY